MNKLQSLEAESRKLEHSPTERKAITEHVIEYVDSFFKKIPDSPSVLKASEFADQYANQPFLQSNSASIEAIIKELEATVDSSGLNLTSGKYLGYIPGGSLYGSALGDLLAAVTNRYAGLYFASPEAVKMENSLVRWMAGVIGYPDTSAGTLNSGGSISNLIALVTSRDAKGMLEPPVENSVIYCTDQAHHSINKAIHIAGLSQATIRYIKVDSSYRMMATELARVILEDKQNGLRPSLIIATAGTTNCGAVDPLTEIARIAKDNDIWFHVDGAYGGLFALCPEGKKVLKGIELSDSVTLDPHKTLFLPYGTGTILVKDRKKLFASFNASADYLLDFPDMNEEWSPADMSPELTRHFRGLRLWLPLKLHGIDPFTAALSEKIHLARYFYEQINALPNFECNLAPELSIVTYRYMPKSGNPDEFNNQLMKAVIQSGNSFISSTRLNGNLALRAAILCFRTHQEHIDLLLNTLKEKANELDEN